MCYELKLNIVFIFNHKIFAYIGDFDEFLTLKKNVNVYL